MAKYSLTWQSRTNVAVADTAAFTDAGYPFFLQGGGATQAMRISEIYIGGESSSTSTPVTMVFSRDSTVAATGLSGCMLALTDAIATAPTTAPVYGCNSTTKPQRSSTLHLLQLSLNTYGGIVRWVASPDQLFSTYGASASLGEVSLSSVTGTGITSGHCLFEAV